MKGAKTPQGYTIIEVLIVLAVSGMMFVIAANFVNGKQQKGAFQSGVNELASRVQDTINSVTDGQYSDYPVGCNFDGLTTDTSVAPDPDGQGSNDQCVFLGKIMHFSVSGNKNQYEIINIAGGRADAEGKPLTSIGQLKPAAISRLTSQTSIPQSLEVKKIKSNTGAEIFSLGFLQGFGNDDGRGARQAPDFYYLDGLNMGTSTTQAESAVNGTNLKFLKSAELCVSDDTRYATITVGFSGSNNNAVVKMLGTTPCVP